MLSLLLVFKKPYFALRLVGVYDGSYFVLLVSLIFDGTFYYEVVERLAVHRPSVEDYLVVCAPPFYKFIFGLCIAAVYDVRVSVAVGAVQNAYAPVVAEVVDFFGIAKKVVEGVFEAASLSVVAQTLQFVFPECFQRDKQRSKRTGQYCHNRHYARFA